MTLKSPQDTFIRSAAGLTEVWRDLLGADGFSVHSLWMIFIGPDGRMSPVVSPIEDLPPEPDDPMLRSVRDLVTHLAEELAMSPAFLLSRPGPDRVLPGDRLWAGGLMRALGPRLSPWPIHLATAGRVRVIAADDIITG